MCIGTTDANQVWLNQDGAQAEILGPFSLTGQLIGYQYSHTIELGDLDGEGDLDGFVGTELGGNRIWINQDLPAPRVVN